MRQFALNTGMTDLGFVGNRFTWCNGRQGRGLIQERLDRGISNGDWRSLFPRALVRHLPRVAFDHSPILLDTLGESGLGPRPFRFEAFWANDCRSNRVVEEAWPFERGGSPAYALCQRLKATKDALRKWNKEVFDNIQSKIHHLQEELNFIQGSDNFPLLQNTEREVRLQLLLAQKEVETL